MDYFLDNIRDHPANVLPKILLVDDKTANLIALRKVLKKEKTEVLECTNGNEALTLMLEHEFALALIDVQMPDMDGYELAEIMRSDQRTSNIPIIFISAIFTSKLNVFKGFELGAYSFITKPFEPLELLNKVSFFIDKYQTKKAFYKSREKFMELYNNSPDMLLTIGLEKSLVLECNSTLLRVTGYSRDEIIYHPFSGLCDISVIDSIKDKIEKKLKPVAETFLIKTKSGDKIDVQLKAEPVIRTNGEIHSYNVSLRDITELTQTKNKLQRTLFDLESFHEELKNFVYLTSHDLQEPLVTLESFLGLIKNEMNSKIDQNGMAYLKYCFSATGRMKEMVNALLDYSRLGKVQDNSETNFQLLLEEVISHLQGSILKTKAQIRVGELPSLCINRGELIHVFQNLISNAIKFQKPGISPSISIDAALESDIWKFSVQDNGIGIPENQIGKLFQMFRQLHERGKYDGMGLGLSMCKKIIEKYHGRIWVESELGKGTTIFFTLPKCRTK